MDSLVSVIVPVYNVEEYLDKCIDSIVNQTYANLEIILVDDGSPDACPQKCDAWAQKDNRIQVIHKKNAGVGFARNSGLDVATGNYVMFVDSDDYLDVNAVDIMVRRMVQDESDCAIAKIAMVHEDGSINPNIFRWITNSAITQDEAISIMGSRQALPVFAWGKLYRREIFNNLRYTQLTYAEDLYILPDIICRCQRISLADSVVYFYIQRATSIVHTKKTTQVIDGMIALLRMSQFLLEYNHIKGASLYYYSAVCKYFKTKGNKEAKRLLRTCYNKYERKLIRQGRDLKMVIAMLAAKFPTAYKFYKSITAR